MIALYRSDRHVEALDVYERTRRHLEDKLGLRPGDELQRLAGQIVRQESHLRTPRRRCRPATVSHEAESTETVCDCPGGSTGCRRDGDSIRQFVLTDQACRAPGARLASP